MQPDDPRHGSIAGYVAHRKAGQTACDDCKRAAAQYQDRRNYEAALGVVRQRPSLGTHRRVQALWALGWTSEQIAAAAGFRSHQSIANLMRRRNVQRATAERIDRAYRALGNNQGPSDETRRRAAAKKYAPPAAWDDIDNDTAPQGVRKHSPRTNQIGA